MSTSLSQQPTHVAAARAGVELPLPESPKLFDSSIGLAPQAPIQPSDLGIDTTIVSELILKIVHMVSQFSTESLSDRRTSRFPCSNRCWRN